jgi:hypothetical protein
MKATRRFTINFFPLFLLGGVSGKLMDDGGAALSGLCSAHLWRCQPLGRAIATLSVPLLSAQECAGYFRHAGYALV